MLLALVCINNCIAMAAVVLANCSLLCFFVFVAAAAAFYDRMWFGNGFDL